MYEELGRPGLGVGNSLTRGRLGFWCPITNVMRALGQRHGTDGFWHLSGRDVLLGGR